MTKIGILALQGAFAEHEQVLNSLSVQTGANRKSARLGNSL